MAVTDKREITERLFACIEEACIKHETLIKPPDQVVLHKVGTLKLACGMGTIYDIQIFCTISDALPNSLSTEKH